MAWSVTAGTVPKSLGQKNVRLCVPYGRRRGLPELAAWTAWRAGRPTRGLALGSPMVALDGVARPAVHLSKLGCS